MTKSNSSRNFFKKKEALQAESSADSSVTPAPVVELRLASSSEDATPDDRQELLDRIDHLETRVRVLETKLQKLVDLLASEMSSGLRMGPEGLGRAIKGSGLLEN